jgi:hypothetical protein
MSPPPLAAPRSLCAALATLCATAALVAAQGAARTQDTARPLFAGHETLRFTLATDLRALLRDRGEARKEHAARLTYLDSAGRPVSLEVEVRTRGNFRLKRTTCAFPPLRLDVPGKAVAGTVFEGQDKLKLVTHCRSMRSFEQSVLHEYLLYRALNLLTDKSYRARLARVTYADTGGQEDSVTRYAVLLESDEELARRHQAQLLEQTGVTQTLTDLGQMTVVALFQYFAGNTDWSVAGLHNITLIQDSGGTPYAVPYDFDWSGVISAPYATPAPQVGTKTVRERVYRGYCPLEEQLAPVIERFNARKDSIYALYRAQEGLEPRELAQALGYFDEFYRVIGDPRLARREFRRNCTGG